MALALFYVVKSLFSAYVTYRQSHVAMLSGAEFASALFAAYLHAPYQYHLHKNSAEIQRNVGVAVDAVFYDILFSLVGLASDLLMTAALVGLTFFVAPMISVLVVGALGLMTGLIYWLTQRRLYRWGTEVQGLKKSVIETIDQSLEGLKEIKILGREGYFTRRFEDSRRRRGELQARRLTMAQLPRIGLETLFIALIAIVLVASKFTAEASGGVLPLLGLYAYTGFRLMPSLARVLSYLQNIRFGSATLQDVESDFATLGRTPVAPAAPQARSGARVHARAGVERSLLHLCGRGAADAARRRVLGEAWRIDRHRRQYWRGQEHAARPSGRALSASRGGRSH